MKALIRYCWAHGVFVPASMTFPPYAQLLACKVLNERLRIGRNPSVYTPSMSEAFLVH